MSAQILLSMIAPGVPPAPQGATAEAADEFGALLAGMAAGAARGDQSDGVEPARPSEDSREPDPPVPGLLVHASLTDPAQVAPPAGAAEVPAAQDAAPLKADHAGKTAPAKDAAAAIEVGQAAPGEDPAPEGAPAVGPGATPPVAVAVPVAVAAGGSSDPAPSGIGVSDPKEAFVPAPSAPTPPADADTAPLAATPPPEDPAAKPAAAPAAPPSPPSIPVAVAPAAPLATPLRALESNAAAARQSRELDASSDGPDADPAGAPTAAPAAPSSRPSIDLAAAPTYRPERTAEVSPGTQPDAPTSDEERAAGEGDAGAAPAADKAASLAREASPPPPAVSRVAVEATAQIAAQILRKLDGRSTRFEMALLPEELGRVDVQLDIDSDGRLAARLAFDNPAAATDLRGRADELRRQLEQAGFHLAEDAFEFTERDSGSSAFDRGDDRRHGSGRAFTAAARLHAEADAVPVARWRSLSLTPAGVDLKV